VEEAWRIVEPAISDPSPIQYYDRGTWGPAASAYLIGDDRHWHAGEQLTD
jgi:glucose-6-phosphate 1-dehydrogenase